MSTDRQQDSSFNHSLRSFLPATAHQSSKRRLSTFSTPATSDQRPTPTFRQSVLRRGKTVLRRAVSSATSSFSLRNNSSLGHSQSTHPVPAMSDSSPSTHPNQPLRNHSLPTVPHRSAPDSDRHTPPFPTPLPDTTAPNSSAAHHAHQLHQSTSTVPVSSQQPQLRNKPFISHPSLITVPPLSHQSSSDNPTPASLVTPVEPASLQQPSTIDSSHASPRLPSSQLQEPSATSGHPSEFPSVSNPPSVSTATSTATDLPINDHSSTASAPTCAVYMATLPSKSHHRTVSVSQLPAPQSKPIANSSDRPDKRVLAMKPRALAVNRRYSLSDHPPSQQPAPSSSQTHAQKKLSQRDGKRPSILPDSMLRRHASTTSTSTAAAHRTTKPLTAQTYIHQRRTSAPTKPQSYTMASSPPIQVTSPAARASDLLSHPAYSQQSAHGTRVSKTGFMERSVAAAVISAARHRTQNAKKARQPSPSKPPHHRLHGGFANPWPSSLKDSGLRSRGGSGSRTFFHKVAKDNRRPPEEQLATMLLLALRPDFTLSADAVRRDKFALASTWIGHSSFYLHARGLTVLTDPVWSGRLGPLGPKRLVPPPCNIDELPPRIDVVILSSACYDHYDKNAIQLLLSRVGQWLVPLGLKALLLTLGVQKDLVVELDWWDEHDVHGSRFICTPSQHYSVREDTLWCSWVVHAPYHRFFYCGATGYRSINRDSEDSNSFDSRVRFGGPTCPAFKEIGRRLGPFDTAFLPIGGFKPRVLMSGVQGDAVDMLFVHRDIGARRSIAHRWGTFQNNDEGMLDSVRMLEFALQTGPVGEHEFCYLKHGRLHLT